MIPEERLRRAAKEANEIHLACLPDEDEIEYEPSPTFKKKMKRLIKRIDHPVLYYSQKVAGFLLVFLVSASLWLTLDTNSRAIFFDWIEEQYGRFQHYFFVDDETRGLPADGDYRLGWVPEGYEESEVLENRAGVIVIYSNLDGQILRLEYQESSEANLFLDIENCEHKSVEIHGQQAEMYLSTSSDDASTIVYINDSVGTLFTITGFLTEEELIKIADNISIQS